MKVRSPMHKGVQWVSPDTPVKELATTMREQDIGAIPVGENDRLVGMATDRDITVRGVANGKDISDLAARDVMTSGIVWCRDGDDVTHAANIMQSKQIRCACSCRSQQLPGPCPRIMIDALGNAAGGAKRMMLILDRRLEFRSTIWIATTMPHLLREIDHANAPIKKHSAMEACLQFSEIRCGRVGAELYVYPHCYQQPERFELRQRRQAFLMRYFAPDRAEVRGAKHEHYRSACRV